MCCHLHCCWCIHGRPFLPFVFKSQVFCCRVRRLGPNCCNSLVHVREIQRTQFRKTLRSQSNQHRLLLSCSCVSVRVFLFSVLPNLIIFQKNFNGSIDSEIFAGGELLLTLASSHLNSTKRTKTLMCFCTNGRRSSRWWLSHFCSLTETGHRSSTSCTRIYFSMSVAGGTISVFRLSPPTYHLRHQQLQSPRQQRWHLQIALECFVEPIVLVEPPMYKKIFEFGTLCSLDRKDFVRVEVRVPSPHCQKERCHEPNEHDESPDSNEYSF